MKTVQSRVLVWLQQLVVTDYPAAAPPSLTQSKKTQEIVTTDGRLYVLVNGHHRPVSDPSGAAKSLAR